jgi:hypothetical protein
MKVGDLVRFSLPSCTIPQTAVGTVINIEEQQSLVKNEAISYTEVLWSNGKISWECDETLEKVTA